MLTVLTWWWSTPGYRTTFTAEHVNTLARMVKRHYQCNHRFIVVTSEDTTGLDPHILVVPDTRDYATVSNPSRQGYPSCYRRLRMFKPDAAKYFGERFVSLDLDCVVTGDLAALWDRSEDFVVWGYTNRVNPYNMSMVLMNAGSRPQVWKKFDPNVSPQRALASGFFGSDQAWLSYILGPGEVRWSRADGVYSFVNDLRPQPGAPLPANSKVVFFHGHADPWMSEVQTNHPWVAEHYQ